MTALLILDVDETLVHAADPEYPPPPRIDFRVGPFEVESACLEHPAVAEAAVVAKPDERRGWIVKAFVVVASGVDATPELGQEISRFVRDSHSAYAYPREVEFVTELPKTLTGKIRRIELRKLEEERAAG